ncbi:MAG TPA: thrombospondin type 3 repeat-containing protein [Planctomycetota bacterium]|nr:thrombospondin type 3 repeat-containing protein [Planctomycetota bacterium]
MAGWLFFPVAPASAQIADQVVLFGQNTAKKEGIARFDRRLNFIAFTKTEMSFAGDGHLDQDNGTTVDGQGRYWVPFDPSNATNLLRMTGAGKVLIPSVILQHNPVRTAAARNGNVYALTRTEFDGNGPLYAAAPDGTVLWSNLAGPALFVYSRDLIITPSGGLWIAGSKFFLHQPWKGLLAEVRPGTGSVIKQATFDNPVAGGFNVSWDMMAASPDGTIWGELNHYLTQVDPETLKILRQFVIRGGSNSETSQLRIDSQGNLRTTSKSTPRADMGGDVLEYSGTGQIISVAKLGGLILGFALGPAGEDLYAVIVENVLPYPRRLTRLNLVTGVKSSRPLAPYGTEWAVPNDDPTGFIWANVIDQAGDNDGDGAANRDETLAGTDPFDPTSRPNGPKVYLSFAPVTNAIQLTWRDPDGLFDPTGGLDLASISLQAGGYGEVMGYLWHFLTSVTLSPDGKQVTIELGGLPLPSDLKIPLEARVADKTGATAWDWQVTPPGDL